MTTNLDKLKSLLAELFMLDQAELDFGIYRVMNAKRVEVTRFLDNDLLPQVRNELANIQTGDRTALESELAKAIAAAQSAGFSPEQAEQSPKVKELRVQLAATVDISALENEVLSDLANFFRRYYEAGDFLALRRYKAGVYAVPYEGEEVKLHWANADQYYIKTSEHLRDYTFKLADGRRVHFKLVEADTEADNKKSANGQERRFILCPTDPLLETNGELIIRFEYRPVTDKRKQAELNALACETILTGSGFIAWKADLSRLAPTEKNPNRTILEKHLGDYTARNTFDYFIHKDIGGFLRRELDFYIKNEIMHLDDIEAEDAPRVGQYLAKIKAIRAIAHKIIAFLEQLENFQKKLWLKKKFVVETNYCVTLDRVPEAFYPEIITNDTQWQEWEELFSISEIAPDLFNPKGQARNSKFLKAHPFLVIDTQFFSVEFKEKLLADDKLLGGAATLDEAIDGLLVHSDNFQALNLIQAQYRERIQCIHIDPPYNTQTSGFLYPNSYQHSSWLAMMDSVTRAATKLLTSDGSYLCHIDENEYERLHLLFDELGLPNGGTIVWDKKNPMLGRKGVATQHEYIAWRTFVEGSIYLRNANFRMIMDMAKEIIQKHGDVGEPARAEFAKWIANYPGLTGGERAYRCINDDGRIYQSVGMGAPEQRTDPKFHIPLMHPNTKKPCPVPESGWSRAPETIQDLITKGEIIFGEDETTQPRRKVFLTEESQRQISSVIQDAGRGKVDVDKLGLEFSYCHPLSLYLELVGAGLFDTKGIVLDFFAGSGTNGHAVIALNRDEDTKRKFILVEVGDHFNTVLKPRIKKVIYSEEWKDGKPVSRKGSTHFVKYLHLESYEDTLNNLELKRTPDQDDLLSLHAELREDYMLRYQLDVEARDSASLLNVAQFTNPFVYQLKIAASSVGESRPVNVDLVETFNYLLGLRVSHTDSIRGFKVVTGLNPAGEKTLVIWRNQAEKSNADLDTFFQKQGYNTKDMEFALIYVNGDNNLENLKRADETWKVRRIEDEFKRLMFDVQDV
jgi:adenine-specific DNA-methyltransferase